MKADGKRDIFYLREKARRLRQIADGDESEASPHLRTLASEIDGWADELERRRS